MSRLLFRGPRFTARAKEAALYAMVVLITVVAVTVALKLWQLDLRIPLAYDGDATLISSHFKTILETGWYLEQPLLGAPAGQAYFDWKITDNLGMLFGVLLRPFTPDFGVVHNLYYLLGFPLAAVTAVWFLRLVGVSRWSSAALAVLYALAPYHFIRGESHMWLASYYPIPLALGIVYQIIRGRPLWGWMSGGMRIGRLRIPPAVGTTGILLLISVANSYYAVITLVLIAAAGLAALVRTRAFRRFLGAVAAGTVVVGTLAVSLIPSTLYGALNGTNSSAVIRLPVEAELYSFKFTQLILPSPQHRLPAFRALRSYYDGVYGNPAESPALGLVAAAGFLALLGVAVYLLTTLGHHRRPRSRRTRAALGALCFLTVVSFLLGTVGGLGSVVSFLTSDLRGWNRISIIIALLSLAGFGLLVDVALRRLRDRRDWRVRSLPALVAILVLSVGVWDQTGPLLVPNYASLTAAYRADQTMTDQIEAATSPTAMILQLPYHPFPEQQSAQGVNETNQLRYYLHSHTLRWSGGGIKGRPSSEWVAAIERLPAKSVITTAVAAGFSGIFVDSFDLSPHGTALATDLAQELGAPSVTSADGRYLFYTLGTASRALSSLDSGTLDRIGTIAVSPVIGQFLPRFDSYTAPQLLQPYSARISLDNDRSETVRVRLRFTLSYSPGATDLTVTLPDGTARRLPATPAGVATELEVDVPPGQTEVTLTGAEDDQVLRSRWKPGPIVASDLEVEDVELTRLLTEATGAERLPPTDGR